MDQVMKNTLSSDLAIRPEFVGVSTLLSPFFQHCASQRLMMFASHITQSLVLDGSEPPRIGTGYEPIVGKYEFSTCRVDQDSLVLLRIPKFNPLTYRSAGVTEIPSYKIIYIGEDDRQVHCMDVATYTSLYDGFGYYNKMLGFENGMLSQGAFIPKGTKLTTSPSHDGDIYKYGVNANVAFMAEWGVTEDAFIVSESLAKKCSNTAIRKIKLNIPLDVVPLNLYGDNESYQCFPCIGDYVREDGALIALRRVNKSTFVSDMTPEALRNIEHLHDEVHRAPPGAKVIDVDVYINTEALKKLEDRDSIIYKQFVDLDECHKYQHRAILDAYRQYVVKEGYECSPEFNTAVFRAATLSGDKEFVKKRTRLCDSREPIELITCEITYAYKRQVTRGSKLTGREGGKGVVSAIWKDEDMPVDDNGIRADIIITPASILNRMNPSQLYEQFWNRTAVQVIRNAKQTWLGGYVLGESDKEQPWSNHPLFDQNWKAIYDYILEFFHDFRPAYAKFVQESITSVTDKMEFVEECLNKGLYLISAFRKPRPLEHIIEVAQKYGVEATPVTYTVRNPDTGEGKTVRTRKPVLIGSKYIILLGKIPSDQLNSVSMGYVNQFELPIKPKSKHIKSQAAFGLTPMKFGEDETCILNMSLGNALVARFYGVHSTSPDVVKLLGKHLITEIQPTATPGLPIKTQDILYSSQTGSMLKHMLGIIGYDVRPKDDPNQKV